VIGLEGITESGGTIAVVVAFFAAIVLVDFFDISLPRGDSISMAGALIAASVVVFGVPVSLAVGLGSTALTQLVHRLRGDSAAPIDEFAARAASILSAGLVSLALLAVGAAAFAIVAVPASYLLAELMTRQVLLAAKGGRSLRRLVAGNIERQSLLFAAQLSVSALAVLTFASLGVWSLIPVVALLVLMRQAYSMLLEIRETYLTTVEVLIEAAESHMPHMTGHSERTATIARTIGSECGLGSAEIERLSYAALLHDVDRIADDPQAATGRGHSAALVEGIAYLSSVVPVLRVVDGRHSAPIAEGDAMSGFIIALASDIDTAGHPGIDAPGEVAAVARVASLVSPRIKAQVVSAALELGYPVPAID
jgi:hypothetical protein